MKNAWKLTIPLFLLSALGASISLLLMNKHVLKSSGPGWFAWVCGDEAPAGEAGADAASTQPAESATSAPADEVDTPSSPPPFAGADCGSVLASRWGTVPPRPRIGEEPDVESQSVFAQIRIPSAFLGFVYFISLAIWFLLIGWATPDKPEWTRLPQAFVVCGVLSSLFFIYIMFTDTAEWCPWCMVTHVINFLILGGTILLRPRRAVRDAYAAAAATMAGVGDVKAVPATASAADDTTDVDRPAGVEIAPPDAAGRIEPLPSHPSYRLVSACVLLSASTCAMVWNAYAVQVAHQNKEHVTRQLETFQKDATFLTEIYQRSPKVKIPIRPDDPMIAKEGEELLCRMVVFSDFQCPFCRTFAKLLEKRLQPLFYGRLRVVWKHYPLAKDCNKHVQNNVHPHACEAARAAEAAHLQGGSESFWKAHDLLFEAQRKLKDFDYAVLANQLELDPQRFLSDMESAQVTERIAEDAELAHSIGVTSTPAVFLTGRKVDARLIRLMPFWQTMAHRYSLLRDQRIKARMAKEKKKNAADSQTQPADHAPTPGRDGAPVGDRSPSQSSGAPAQPADHDHSHPGH
ncbi:MAG: thioredoxin domain-containing protein [bacterium]|nr:thioredoxin domain-containing protein [bacterium]